jgi:hypothetical protein
VAEKLHQLIILPNMQLPIEEFASVK